MALARAQTQTPWSGDKHTNHEASVLTLWVAHKNITAAFYNREICCWWRGHQSVRFYSSLTQVYFFESNGVEFSV